MWKMGCFTMRINRMGKIFLFAAVTAVLAIVFTRFGWAQRSDDGPFLVVLDPGHGGSAPGAIYGGVEEKDINLAVAQLVRALLEEQEGVEVLMTREGDEEIGLYERSNMANEAHADLFVSLHSNALENDSGYAGIMTFYWTRQSRSAAGLVQDAVISATGAKDRGVRTEEYIVVREADMPAVLIEMGFMTCPEELARMTDPEYQAKLAQGIAQGILQCRD